MRESAFSFNRMSMEVHLCGLRGLVPEPECNHGAIHTMMKKVHGCGMSADMGGDLLLFERRATPHGQIGVFGEEILDRIATESAATDVRKDWILWLTVALP